jgi:site-specific recombinase XerD
MNVENQKINWKYLDYLRRGKNFSPKTILKYENALQLCGIVSNNSSYKNFSEQFVIHIKDVLVTEVNQHLRSPRNAIQILSCVYNFFTWLQFQPGYRSRVKSHLIEILKPGRTLNLQAKQSKRVEFEPLSKIKEIMNNIVIHSDIDLRNRILNPSIVLSGIRIEAFSTLPVCCFDPNRFMFDQDPTKGVCTRFGKHIFTHLLKFDDQMEKYIMEYYDMLINKGFKSMDPFIPAAEPKRLDGLGFTPATDLSNKFLSAPRLRKIMQDVSLEYGNVKINPHSLRHLHTSLGRNLAQNPEEYKAISMNIGHEKITTTDHYGELSPSELESVIANMNNRKKVESLYSKNEEKIIQAAEEIIKNKRG